MDVEPVRQALPGSRVTPVATGAAGRPVAAGNGSQGPVGQGVQAVRRSMSAVEAMFWDKLEAMKRTYAAALSQIAPATNIMASRQPAEKQETFRKHMRDCLQILSIDNSHPLPPHVNVGLLNSAERFMQSVIRAYRSYSKALRERNAAIAAGTAGKASGTAGPVGLVQQATPQQHQSAPPQAAVQGATQNPQMQIVRQLQERQMRQAGSAGMHAAAVVTSTAQRSVAAHASPASSSAVCAPIGIAQQAQNELTTNTPVGSKGGATVIHGKTPATVKESGKHQHGIMPSVKLQSHFNTNAVGMPKKSTSGPIVKHLPEQKAFPLAARQDAKAGRNEHPSTATASRPVPRTTASLGTLKANHCDQGPATCGPEARTEGVTASGNVRGHSANDATGSLKNEASGENISCAHEQAVRSPVVRQDAAPGGASEDMPSSAVDSQPVIANSTDEQKRQPAASVEGGTDDRDAHPLVTHQEDAIDGLDDQPAAAAGSIAPEKGTGDYARVPNLKKRSREQITRDSQVNQVLEIVQLAAEQAEHLERYEDARIQDTLDAMREGGTRSLTDGTNGDQLLNGALDDFEREFGTKLGKALEKAANSTLRTKSTETGLRPVKRLKE